MPKIIRLSILLFFTIEAFSQEFKPMSDSGGLINGLGKQIEIKTFQAMFVETKSISFVQGELESKGTLAFSNDGNIRWEYKAPNASVMVITQKTIKLRENGKTKNLKGIGGVLKKVKELIGGCITGDILKDKNYKRSFIESDTEYRVELVPLQRRMQQIADFIQVDFTKEDLRINSVVMLDSRGDRTSIEFNHLQINKDLPSGVFILN